MRDFTAVIERCLGCRLGQSHIDLRYVLKGLGHGGGLKSCERQLRIERPGKHGVDRALVLRGGLIRGREEEDSEEAGGSAHQTRQFNTPTIAPIRHVVSVPDTIDLKPSERMSLRLVGAMVPSPAIMMPSEPKLAKPHIA